MTDKYTTADGAHAVEWDEHCTAYITSHAESETMPIPNAEAVAFSEYIMHRHGVWIDPETGAVVLRTKASDDGDGRAVITHIDGKAVTVWEHLSTRDSTLRGIKERYFAAHPAPKPKWHDAEIGEAWLLTIRGEQSVYVVDKFGDFIGPVPSEGHSLARLARAADKITAGVRLWPTEGGAE